MGKENNNSIVKNVEELGDGFVDMFVNNIQAIFFHPRTDIVKVCTNFSNEQLKILPYLLIRF